MDYLDVQYYGNGRGWMPLVFEGGVIYIDICPRLYPQASLFAMITYRCHGVHSEHQVKAEQCTKAGNNPLGVKDVITSPIMRSFQLLASVDAGGERLGSTV